MIALTLSVTMHVEEKPLPSAIPGTGASCGESGVIRPSSSNSSERLSRMNVEVDESEFKADRRSRGTFLDDDEGGGWISSGCLVAVVLKGLQAQVCHALLEPTCLLRTQSPCRSKPGSSRMQLGHRPGLKRGRGGPAGDIGWTSSSAALC